MSLTTLNSNKIRDFIAEAAEYKSTATTKKGAIRYLIKHHKRIARERKWEFKRSVRGVNLNLPYEQNYHRENREPAYRNKIAARKADPDAKRARDDKQFRKNYAARLRRQEHSLMKINDDSIYLSEIDAAMKELNEIYRLRAIAGIKSKPLSRPWRSRKEAQWDLIDLAEKTGLRDTGNSTGRGDHFELYVVDVAFGSRSLKRYYAVGEVVGVVCQTRTRVYAKSSDFKQSIRRDYFLVGTNENGRPYRHQLPRHMQLGEVTSWIWSNADIIARQGDVAVAGCNLKYIEGEFMDTPVAGGHSRHRFIGDVHFAKNGNIFVKSGFLIHTGNQHPPIYLDGSCWRRIIIARRSERGMSSSD